MRWPWAVCTATTGTLVAQISTSEGWAGVPAAEVAFSAVVALRPRVGEDRGVATTISGAGLLLSLMVSLYRLTLKPGVSWLPTAAGVDTGKATTSRFGSSVRRACAWGTVSVW